MLDLGTKVRIVSEEDMKISLFKAMKHETKEYRVAVDYWSRDFSKVEQCGYKEDDVDYSLVQQILDENYSDWFDEMIKDMERNDEV